ncbi:hypothetical protein VTO73DRAFT_5455 [Trametes versicolor]
MNPSRISVSDGRTSFAAVYAATVSCLQNVPSLRHVSREKIVQFGMDISIVACGVRLGYLFDAFAVRDRRRTVKEVLTDCLSRLQKDILPFANVCLVHDPTSDQLFFVNVHGFLNSSLSGSTIADKDVTFISVKGSSAERCTTPPGLQTLFADLVSLLSTNFELSTVLPEDQRTRDLGTMVAFAACILEFPVAYVPTADGSGAFLAGVPLDVYECVLEVDTCRSVEVPDNHVMLKFSCPQDVARIEAELHPEAMIGRLQALFETRLSKVAFPGRVSVHHSIETLDRVAL